MQTIPELLLARAADCGDRTFCTFEGKKTTFRDLLAKVQEAAGILREAGVAPGERVGFMMPPSVEHIAFYLSTSWLGAAAVPFSIHLKSAGIELQLRSARPKVFIVSRAFEEAVRQAIAAIEAPPRVIWFENGDDARGAETSIDRLLRTSRAQAQPAPRSLDDLLAINYTSGTTGAPKGAMLSERYYWIGARSAGILSEASRSDVYFMWEPFYHIAAWMTVMMALQHGLSIYMVERFSASRLWDQVADGGATKLHYLGGLVNILLAQPPVAAEKNNTVSIAWGGACPGDTWRQFEQRFELTVREGYGLSEAQNFTHLNMDGVLGSIGKPIDEFDAWLIDDAGNRVGPGVVGEIVLRPKLPNITMMGYFGEPERTAEVLRADGCVYTGDTAVMDEHGYFYFKGRKKDALRRRGENVSAWEVERVINAAPDVEESAVIGVPSPMGEQDILALVKPKDGATVDPLALVRFCSERLAYYQVPRYIQVVEDFPRGPTQRIRKNEIEIDLSTAWDAERAGFKPERTA